MVIVTVIAGLVVLLFVLTVILLGVGPLRRRLISARVLKLMTDAMPGMSATEKEALEAGTVWWDGELFAGHPDWKKMMEQKLPGLSRQEEAFLAGPVEKLCRMTDDWEVNRAGDLPPEVWDFLKKERFFGMIIPLRGRDAHGQPQRGSGGDHHGAQLPGSGRTAAPLRDRGAAPLLPAAPGQR
jgi:acyl-CoA dehydrogenase